jgi:hypothetical protein
MFLPSQGFRHAVDLLLKNRLRQYPLDARRVAEELVALADDMKAPPAAAEWLIAEYERVLGPGVDARDILARVARARPPAEPRDLFLIHVPEDRLPTAGPLAVELAKRRVTVAFSEYEVATPDDLLTAVARGLAEHRAGAVLITPEFERRQLRAEGLDARLILVRDLASPARAADAIVRMLGPLH